jgi:hypothetical protein
MSNFNQINQNASGFDLNELLAQGNRDNEEQISRVINEIRLELSSKLTHRVTTCVTIPATIPHFIAGEVAQRMSAAQASANAGGWEVSVSTSREGFIFTFTPLAITKSGPPAAGYELL